MVKNYVVIYMDFLGISKVAPIDKLSVVLVAIFATIFLGEHSSLREWIGIFLVAVGVLVLTFKF